MGGVRDLPDASLPFAMHVLLPSIGAVGVFFCFLFFIIMGGPVGDGVTVTPLLGVQCRSIQSHYLLGRLSGAAGIVIV